MVSWGAAVWNSVNTTVMVYDSARNSIGLWFPRSGRCIQQTLLLPFSHQEGPDAFLELWELISGPTLWGIWKARCAANMVQKKIPPAKTIKEIWSIIVHSLKGQLESIEGHSEPEEKQRWLFHLRWRSYPFYSLIASRPVWNYQPPRCLFPLPT